MASRHRTLKVESNTKDVRAKLRVMGDRIANPDEVWPRVGRYLSLVVRRQFYTRGSYLGTPWAPLKPDYLLWKAVNGYPQQTLVMRGDLRDSFGGRPMGIEKYRGNTAVFGSDDKKAIWHQKGTRRNGRQINPARPMLVLNPMVREEITDIVRSFVMDRDRGKY